MDLNRSAAAPPILVTGSHRSGTTWVGRMLALAPQLGYIGEPFNPLCRPGVCRAGFSRWFMHLDDGNAAPYLDALRDSLNFRYDALAELKALGANGRMPADVAPAEVAFIQEYTRFTAHHLQGARPLVKDPIAFFSAEWLAREFGMQVLVLVRHPAAFAASLKRLDWKFPFADLAGQEALMEGLLKNYRDPIRAYAADPPDIIRQASLFWNCVYHTAGEYRRRHPDWIFLRHEDMSRAPVQHFRHLFERFGLPFTPGVEAGILDHSKAGNARDWKDGDNPHGVKFDSAAAVKKWRGKLTADEVDSIRRDTAAVARRWNADGDW